MKGWRTIAVGCFYSVLGLLLILFGSDPLEAFGVGLIVGGASMCGMRTITTTRMGNPS